MKCVICGRQIEKSEYNNAALCSSQCFSRLHWKEILDDNAIIIDGRCYHVGTERRHGFLGHAGREFVIRKDSGETIKTNNLWSDGEIPDFAHRPDNAKFISKG